MIYVATVHVTSARWIDLQLAFLRRHMGEPFKVYANLQNVPPGHAEKFDRVITILGDHAGKLNLLAGEIVADADPDDIVIFLDGDAFPIADPMPCVRKGLETSTLVAVRRDENVTDRQPHPSFCAIRVRDWERLHGDWSQGYPWEAADGRPTTDVGGNLLRALERAGDRWTPLLRSNRVNLHPLWFGVYGDIVYHHGAGFRWAVGRVDLVNPPRLTTRAKHVPGLGRLLRRRNRARAQRFHARTAAAGQRLSDDVYHRIETDPEFYRELI
ncbi:MAG TPA: hypothetical protein VMU64_07790 [Acidimicrobiales bacterium]|nr:hypothetical protein [Acidimicrobiales bacterium]